MTEAFKVTQADELAASKFGGMLIFSGVDRDLAQAFARHRHEAQAELLAMLKEAREALVKIESLGHKANLSWGDAADAAATAYRPLAKIDRLLSLHGEAGQ